MKKLTKLILPIFISTFLLVNTVFAKDIQDVPKSHWAYPAIAQTLEQGIFTLNEEGNFKPNEYINKFEAMKILANFIGYSPLNASINNEVFAKYENLLKECEKRYERWESSVNPEIAFLLDRAILKPEDLTSFTIKTDTGEKTRALSVEDVSTYFVRLIKWDGEALSTKDFGEPFTDDSFIDENLKPYVYTFRKTGYISPDSENNIKPKQAVTKAWISVLLYQIQSNSIYTYEREDITKEDSQINTGENIYEDKVPQIAEKYLDNLNRIDNDSTAVQVVKLFAESMTKEERKELINTDVIIAFTEEAIAKACSITMPTEEYAITQSDIDILSQKSDKLKKQMESILKYDFNVNLTREIRRKIVFKNHTTTDLDIDFENIKTDVDIIQVENQDSYFSLDKNSINNLNQDFYVKLRCLTYSDNKNVYELITSIEDAEKKLILGIPLNGSDRLTATVFNSENVPMVSKYNIISNKLETKIFKDGTYFSAENIKNFADIENKAEEVKLAINTLASKSIIYGKSLDRFYPDSPITRADFSTMVLNSINREDKNSTNYFSDAGDYYENTAIVLNNYGYVKGYPDGSFKGNSTITKEEAMAITVRVLFDEMPYKDLYKRSNLMHFADAGEVSPWARSQTIKALGLNLIPERTDNYLVPKEVLTRGDAAVIVMRLYSRL